MVAATPESFLLRAPRNEERASLRVPQLPQKQDRSPRGAETKSPVHLVIFRWEANGRDDINKRARDGFARSIDERARHEGGVPGHGRGARHAQVRLRASRRSRAPPPVPSWRDKIRASARHPPFAVAVRVRRCAKPQPTMTRVAPAHRSQPPPHVGPGSRKTSSSITCASSSIARGRAWCSVPTGADARAPATSAGASSRDAASGCSTGPPSTDRRTRSIA